MSRKTVAYVAMGLAVFFARTAMAEHLGATISIDRIATLTSDRLVVKVTGSYICGPIPQPQGPGYTFGTLEGIVRQASGRSITEGYFGLEPICDGQPHVLEFGASATTMPWHGGQARVWVNVSVQECDPSFVCESASGNVDTEINIRGDGN